MDERRFTLLWIRRRSLQALAGLRAAVDAAVPELAQADAVELRDAVRVVWQLVVRVVVQLVQRPPRRDAVRVPPAELRPAVRVVRLLEQRRHFPLPVRLRLGLAQVVALEAVADKERQPVEVRVPLADAAALAGVAAVMEAGLEMPAFQQPDLRFRAWRSSTPC
jgi:hypothetical protein